MKPNNDTRFGVCSSTENVSYGRQNLSYRKPAYLKNKNFKRSKLTGEGTGKKTLREGKLDILKEEYCIRCV